MGFLKRFFSLSSKRSKKSKRNRHEDTATASHQPAQPQAQEGDATRLLRSSSAHFSVVKEVDYASLPPLPHPINNIVTPATTPARSASSLQRQGTYTVTVHERTVHSRTEFPNANPSLQGGDEPRPELPHHNMVYFDESPTRARFNPQSVPFTPHDQSRVLRLRKDPSVASLLNMFDDKGRINSNAFSNTPRTEAPIEEIGRQQVKRSGSTLRQLLGAPETDNAYDETAMMGDISWAERFIGEHGDDNDDDDSISVASSSSLPLETPKDSYPHTPSDPHALMDTAFSLETSLSEMSVNYPTFSSMEVELSGSTGINVDATCDTSAVKAKLAEIPEVYITPNPETPQRPATEIFGFLTERKKSLRQQKEQQRERDLPAVPTPSLSDASSQLKTPMSTSNLFSTTPQTNNSSPATTNSDTSSGQIHTATITKLTPVMNPLSRSTDTLNILQSYTPTPGAYPKYPLATPSSEHRVRFDDDIAGDHILPSHATGSSNLPRHHTGSTLRSQPTGSTLQSQATGSSSSSRPSRIPKGPRPVPTTSQDTEIAYLNRPTTPLASTSSLNLPSENSQRTSRIPKATNGPPRSRTPDPFSLPQYSSRIRTTSRGSIAPVIFDDDEDEDRRLVQTPVIVKRSTSRKPVPSLVEKENSPVSSTAPKQSSQLIALQKTPQSHSHSRAIFESRHPNMVNGEVPSPASSTELSPFGRNMMSNLRQQKMSQKEARRQQALAFAGFAR